MSVILTLAIGLRLVGVAINLEANDNHMEVVRIIAHQHHLPVDGEAWEAFQPKLYHVTVAALLSVLPSLSEDGEIVAGQAVSCVAGLLTLLVLYAFLRDLPLSARTRQVAFALVALNPKMIVTSIQATNDAFVILFATIAITAGYRFFKTFAHRDFAIMTAAVVLAGISKGTGLPVAIAVGCAFVAALIKPTLSRLRIIGFAATFLMVSIALILPLGSYWSRYQRGHSMFAINMQLYVSPQGSVVNRPGITTELNRPGITSVASGYLTFRLADMLQHPVITYFQDNYPLHRTSLWSFLYGSANSIHYDPPWSWQSQNPIVLWVLRATWILALLPWLVMVIGWVRGVLQSVSAALSGVATRDSSAEVLLAAVAAGYIAFLIVFTYRYRDFGTMKSIYIYPAIAPFLAYFARELERQQQHGGSLLARFAYASVVPLCAAYVADTAMLLVHLLR
jgi:hypothetical protein